MTIEWPQFGRVIVFWLACSCWLASAGEVKTVPIAIERLGSIDWMDDWDWTHAMWRLEIFGPPGIP